MIGGLGGFILPICFGIMNDLTGVYTSGFMSFLFHYRKIIFLEILSSLGGFLVFLEECLHLQFPLTFPALPPFF